MYILASILLNSSNAQSVIDVFNWLEDTLGCNIFCQLFLGLLTDNGSEISNPRTIEFNRKGKERTRIFYCDPVALNQKHGVEEAYKNLSITLPKRTSFALLTKEKLNLITTDSNGFESRKLNARSPIIMFSFLHRQDLLAQLQIPSVTAGKICLTPNLFR